MQRERAVVEAQGAAGRAAPRAAARALRHAGRAIGLGTANRTIAIAASASTPGHRENARHADPPLSTGPATSEARSGADRDADDRHRARAHLVARQVRGQRHDRRRDGARALQGAARGSPPDVGPAGGDEAAEREQQEPDINHGLAPHLSEAQPNGICRIACVRPYAPSARPTRCAWRRPAALPRRARTPAG